MPVGAILGTLGSAFSSALPGLIGTALSGVIGGSARRSQPQAPPPTAVLTPEVRQLYGSLAHNLAGQLAQSQNGPSPLVQKAFQQANHQGLDTLEREFNKRGLLRSGLFADQAQKFLSNQAGQLAQANLSQRQNAFNNALRAIPTLTQPGQLSYAAAAQKAAQQRQNFNDFAPFLQTGATALGKGIDQYFANRANPSTSKLQLNLTAPTRSRYGDLAKRFRLIS